MTTTEPTYAGLTASALWAAIAECGAGPMAIDPAVVAALLNKAELYPVERMLWDAVTVLGKLTAPHSTRYIAFCQDRAGLWTYTNDERAIVESLTCAIPHAALIALAGKIGERK